MLVEEQTQYNAYHEFGFSQLKRRGQRLTISNRTITKLGFWLSKKGHPPGVITFAIYKVSDGSLIVEKLWGNADDLTTSPVYREVTFDTPTLINEEVRIAAVDTESDTNNYPKFANIGADVKSGEVKTIYNIGVWSDYATRDAAYRYTYVGVLAVTIQPMTDVLLPTAKAHGTITALGESPCTQHGHCWNTTGTPTIDDDKTELGAGAEGSFESTLTGLLPSTPYYVRAYATDGEGTVYSAEINFLAITELEINPTYVEGHGGGLKTLTETEGKPTYFGEGGGGWNVFAETELSPLLPAPEVTTDPALWIGPLSATPHGTLDSGGGLQPCDCGFEWGETDAYGNTTPTEKKETGESFSQAITGLLPNTTYHFRAFATGFGTSYGADRTFTTAAVAILATVTTDPATGLAPALATINGTLNQDGGEACVCGFDWGLDTGYGTTTPTESKTTGEAFSQVIGGLVPNTVYHFRAFATNSVGTSHGDDRTFTTALVISRAYALAREEL